MWSQVSFSRVSKDEFMSQMQRKKKENKRLHLQHESMRGMDENGGVVLGGGLQAELSICGPRVVREGDTRRQFAVVQ